LSCYRSIHLAFGHTHPGLPSPFSAVKYHRHSPAHRIPKHNHTQIQTNHTHHIRAQQPPLLQRLISGIVGGSFRCGRRRRRRVIEEIEVVVGEGVILAGVYGVGRVIGRRTIQSLGCVVVRRVKFRARISTWPLVEWRRVIVEWGWVQQVLSAWTKRGMYGKVSIGLGMFLCLSRNSLFSNCRYLRLYITSV